MKRVSALPFTFVWLGFLLAISFFEAPLKFQAPSISLEQGVEIGQIVFYWMNKVELVLAIVLVLHMMVSHTGKIQKLLILFLCLLVVFQGVYLLPKLDQQAQLLFDGMGGRNPMYHNIYVACEVIKAIALIWLGRLQLKRMRATEH